MRDGERPGGSLTDFFSLSHFFSRHSGCFKVGYTRNRANIAAFQLATFLRVTLHLTSVHTQELCTADRRLPHCMQEVSSILENLDTDSDWEVHWTKITWVMSWKKKPATRDDVWINLLTTVSVASDARSLVYKISGRHERLPWTWRRTRCKLNDVQRPQRLRIVHNRLSGFFYLIPCEPGLPVRLAALYQNLEITAHSVACTAGRSTISVSGSRKSISCYKNKSCLAASPKLSQKISLVAV